jgi:hypothetical protein
MKVLSGAEQKRDQEVGRTVLQWIFPSHFILCSFLSWIPFRKRAGA